MHGATMEEDGLQGGGVLANIDFKSWGVPAPDSLFATEVRQQLREMLPCRFA